MKEFMKLYFELIKAYTIGGAKGALSAWIIGIGVLTIIFPILWFCGCFKK